MAVAILWMAWLLILWVNDLPVEWPREVDLAGMIPFASGSRYDYWYHWVSSGLCALAAWQVIRLLRGGGFNRG